MSVRTLSKPLKRDVYLFLEITDLAPDTYRLPKQIREALEHGKDEDLLLPDSESPAHAV